MGEMTIRNIDEGLLSELHELANRQGIDPSDLARDALTYSLRAFPRGKAEDPSPLLSSEARDQRDELLRDLREIRAMTLKPLASDSTLVIREMRDTQG